MHVHLASHKGCEAFGCARCATCAVLDGFVMLAACICAATGYAAMSTAQWFFIPLRVFVQVPAVLGLCCLLASVFKELVCCPTE